ncbi:PASTA domain-containing protein [bacterium]|nr:PASTA domain-containing protein [bacterium]
MVGRRNLNRVIITGILGAIVWVVIVGRLFAVQVISSNEWDKKAREQHRKVEKIQALRGVIYGHDNEALAKNSIAFDFWTTKTSVCNVQRVDSMFSDVLGFEPGYTENRIKNSKGNWLYIARHVDLAKAQKLKALEEDSVFSIPIYDRVYPYGQTAGQILGFINVDSKGMEGIELYYDSYLEGQDGERVVISDAAGRPYRVYQLGGKPTIPGADVYLTIDPNLQQIVETELAEGVESFGAENGMAVFLKPSTGEILAMACYPDYDPNQPGESDIYSRKIRQITDIYEPGSTFKIVTFSALLENDAFAVDETVDCEDGSWYYCNDTIHDADNHGKITAREVLVHSSNIGTIKLSFKLSPQILYTYARAFGFGSPTGVDLPGEVVGILHRPETWSRMTPAAFPMGHEVAVTAIQMATAYAAIANRGIMMQPYLVESVQDPSGRIIRQKTPTEIRRVMDEDNAEILCKLLQEVVDSGTGVRAAIEGMTVAGKTGTAQKVKENGRGYWDDKFISSFVGFAPVESPQIVGVIIIDNPSKGLYWGGWTGAPVWKNIVTKAFATGIVSPVVENNHRQVNKSDFVIVPDVRRMSASQAIDILEFRNLQPDTFGIGFVIGQSPLPGRLVPPSSRVSLMLKSNESKPSNQVEIPDVIGMPLRDAVLEMAQANVNFRIVGMGVVENQDPKPGKFINRDDICLLKCAIRKSL